MARKEQESVRQEDVDAALSCMFSEFDNLPVEISMRKVLERFAETTGKRVVLEIHEQAAKEQRTATLVPELTKRRTAGMNDAARIMTFITAPPILPDGKAR